MPIFTVGVFRPDGTRVANAIITVYTPVTQRFLFWTYESWQYRQTATALNGIIGLELPPGRYRIIARDPVRWRTGEWVGQFAGYPRESTAIYIR